MWHCVPQKDSSVRTKVFSFLDISYIVFSNHGNILLCLLQNVQRNNKFVSYMENCV